MKTSFKKQLSDRYVPSNVWGENKVNLIQRCYIYHELYERMLKIQEKNTEQFSFLTTRNVW